MRILRFNLQINHNPQNWGHNNHKQIRSTFFPNHLLWTCIHRTLFFSPDSLPIRLPWNTMCVFTDTGWRVTQLSRCCPAQNIQPQSWPSSVMRITTCCLTRSANQQSQTMLRSPWQATLPHCRDSYIICHTISSPWQLPRPFHTVTHGQVLQIDCVRATGSPHGPTLRRQWVLALLPMSSRVMNPA